MRMRVILSAPEVHPLEGYDRVACLDQAGIVQPMAYGRDQFLRTIDEANGLGMEVMPHAVALAGQEAFLRQLEGAWHSARERLGLL